MRHPFRVASLLVVGALLLAASWFELPYYAEGPGPVRDVTTQITLGDAERFEPSGRMIWTTVRFTDVTPLTALAVWLDPERRLITRDELYGGGDPQQQVERAISDMDQSKIDATALVLGMLTDYPRDRSPGALVRATAANCPADGELFPGDVITAIDGEPVGGRREAARLIGAAEEGSPMTFDLLVDGEPETATFAREPCGDAGEDLVGVVLLDPFPVDVRMESGEVGGPSAGLMWALGLYELMTPGDLTAGRLVAGTGTIDPEGNVGPIGGIGDKVVAAREAGADVFLVPEGNADELDGLDVGSMELVSVASFEDALEALEQG
jgi:PDZ domain-containing protein